MSRKLPHGGVDRVRITWTTAELGEESGVDVCGRKPHLLLYVRTYCDAMRRLWFQGLRHTGCVVVEQIPVGDMDEHGHYKTLVCRVVGTPDQLESLVMYGCVERWEYVLNARVGFKAVGSGPEKMRPMPKGTMEAGTGIRTIPTSIADDTTEYATTAKGKDKWVSGVDENVSLREARLADAHTDKPRTSF